MAKSTPNSQKPLPELPATAQPQMKLPTLMGIGGDMVALTQLLFEIGGDVSDPSVDLAITGWLTENKQNLASKIDTYCFTIDEFYARAEAQKKVGKAIVQQGQYAENAGDRLKLRLKEFMLEHGIEEAKGNTRRAALSKQSDRKTVKVNDESLVPVEYLVPTYTVDKKKVEADLLAGKTVPGCTLEPCARAFRIY